MSKKRSKPRYKMLEQVGAGDYAKVYAAEDTKLGRSVAVKQLHSQYLDDEERLDRYWREAQLLLDLEHPNIMTIYDVVKSRGCLVLELMKGNLKQVYGNRPMPIEEVRETLLQAARGLDCLHSNGIVHGDIKPANLMLSRQDVVKLGDFGLARRANDDEGSLLKGTTKYMAPELVSEDFGDVGPASDLYSLGFSALELMIGPEFDSLFPDLIAFGRDKQMAWMMWHCSADRRFPPIQTVLEGVPDDLARVLQKLTCKEQKHRYKSARELIADLTSGAKPVGESIREGKAAALEKVRRHKRKRRFQALGACLASLCLSGAILWANRDVPAPLPAVAPPSVRGVVRNVLPHDEKFVLDLGNDWKEFTVRNGDDLQLNRKKRQLRDLQIGDRVVVHTRLGDSGNPSHREIIAFRPETHEGIVTSVDSESGQLLLAVSRGEDTGQSFELSVADETQFILNKKTEIAGQPIGLADLAQDDRVVIDLSDDESGMLALKIDALRLVELSGVIRKLDPRNGSLTIAESNENEAENLVSLPIDSSCVFTLNGLTAVDDKLLSVKNIQIGDRVTLKHDVKIQSIEAYRAFEDKGRIVDVSYDESMFILKSQSATASRKYRVDSKTQVLLGEEAVRISALRIGDTVQLVHESPDDDSPIALSVNATRPTNRNKRAILIANQDFDSPAVMPLKTSLADVESIKNQLISRFGVPEDQLTVYENEGRVRLESEIPNILRRVGSDDILYVYVATRGFNDKNRNAYLATREFTIDEMEKTGVGLDWLIDQLDSISTKQKLLILDCCPSDSAVEAGPVSATEMIEVVKQNKRGGYPRTTFVLASCRAGEQPLAAPDCPDNGLFGKCLSDAFSGSADQERDMDVAITELTTFVTDRVTTQAQSQNGKQTPRLFTPDDTPPRLSDQARKSIIELLAQLDQKGLEQGSIMSAAAVAERQSGGQPEPMIACGLLLIKIGKINEALEILENIRLGNRGFLIADQAVVWIHFYKRHYKLGTSKLVELLQQIPKPEKKGEVYSEDDLQRFEWAGRLRELAGSADWTSRIPDPGDLEACDQVVKSHGDLPGQQYAAGREVVRQIIAQFAEDIKNDPKSNSLLERQRIGCYVPPIASPETVAIIRRGLDQ